MSDDWNPISQLVASDKPIVVIWWDHNSKAWEKLDTTAEHGRRTAVAWRGEWIPDLFFFELPEFPR